MLELIVKVININLPVNHELLAHCRPLYEYSWFIQKIKEYMINGYGRDEAIIKTIGVCEREGIMVDFVREHGTEAVNMLFTQFNLEDAMEVRYEEGFEDGAEKGDMLRLIQQVYRKFLKGKEPIVIAQELEEELDVIERIYKAIELSGSDGDMNKIYDELKKLS